MNDQEGIPEIQDLSELIQVRRDKLEALRAAGEDPYALVRFDKTHGSRDIQSAFESLEGATVALAGRMTSKRIMGKASFAHVLDGQGTIQIYAKRDILGEDAYNAFKKLDIGDILGVEGRVFRTHAGEVTVEAARITLLSKSLLPMPEKFHGLKDPDLRYRQRYLDLIMNPEVRETFLIRTQILKSLRRALDALGFLEVETPVLSTHPTNAAAKPFCTHHNTLDVDMVLRIETELYLKRLIVGGFERVYEIGRIFRNEGMSVRHNPEFTMLELYQAYTDYEGMMQIVEQLFSTLAMEIKGTTEFLYQGEMLNLTPPWTRMTMVQSVQKYAGVDFDAVASDEEARALAADRQLHLERADMTKGDILNAFFEAYVEENLVQPTFILDYPVEISPLAKRKIGKPGYTERFEFFMYRREMGNAFSELNDPLDQRERFQQQAAAKAKETGKPVQMDEDFLTAIEYGMPPTGGLGFGVDRLVMLLTDAPSIRDVLLFPTMRPRTM